MCFFVRFTKASDNFDPRLSLWTAHSLSQNNTSAIERYLYLYIYNKSSVFSHSTVSVNEGGSGESSVFHKYLKTHAFLSWSFTNPQFPLNQEPERRDQLRSRRFIAAAKGF